MVLNLLSHGVSLVQLIYDERDVKLTEDEETLWRMFYRHSGLSKLLFKSLLAPCMLVINYIPGEILETDRYFYIILDGVVDASIVHNVNEPRSQVVLCSGAAFSLKLLQNNNYIPRPSIFGWETMTATCRTRVRAYRFAEADLKRLSRLSDTKDAWNALLITTLSNIASRLYTADHPDSDGRLTTKEGSSSQKTFRHAIFRELEDFEQPDPLCAGSGRAAVGVFGVVRHLLHAARDSFSVSFLRPRMPGIRHGHLPAPPSDDPLLMRMVDDVVCDEETAVSYSEVPSFDFEKLSISRAILGKETHYSAV